MYIKVLHCQLYVFLPCSPFAEMHNNELKMKYSNSIFTYPVVSGISLKTEVISVSEQRKQ